MKLDDLKSYKTRADRDWKKYQKDGIADGYVEYFNKHGKHHRSDGPSIIGPLAMIWQQDGEYHRDIDEGPAHIYRNMMTSSRSEARHDGETYYMNGMKVHGPEDILYTMRHTGTDRIAQEERSHGDTDTPAYINDTNMSIKGLLRLVGFRFGHIFPEGFDFNKWVTDGPIFRLRVWEDKTINNHHVPRRANDLPGIVFDEYNNPDGTRISIWYQAGMIHNQKGPAIVVKAHGETYNFWCIDNELNSAHPSDAPPQAWIDAGGKING